MPEQIDPLDEFLALKTAVTRSGDPENPNSSASQGAPYNTTFPGKTMGREAALRAITTEGARFLRASDKLGSLELGKIADIIVLERNYFTVPAEEIGRQRVLLTMLGGEVLYVADGVSFGVKPKFPNNDAQGLHLESRAVGGFAGIRLPEDYASASRPARHVRCDHKHD
jgi:hypothetical protein